MPRHVERAVEAMQEVLDRARLRDSAEFLAYSRAAAVAAFSVPLLDDPTVEEEHKQWLRDRLHEMRGWLAPYWQAVWDVDRDTAWQPVAAVLSAAAEAYGLPDAESGTNLEPEREEVRE